jgi:SAM-dependent methyltransferase
MILDVGCGHLSSHLSRGNINTDISKPYTTPENFVLADAHHLPFMGNLFEKVYFYDVIEHVENPSQCLREIRRVLKPNGTVEISTPNPLHWRTFLRVGRGKKIELGGREHISTWTHIEMEILMEKAGFRDVEICYTILATEKHYSKRHILLDRVAYKFLPSGISGRNMIATALK